MSFEDLLKKKLGPMRDLVSRKPRPDPPIYDPAQLYYRRAVGLEARARPEESWARIELGRADRPNKNLHLLDAKTAGVVLGLTSFTHASKLPLSPDELWQLVDHDLLFFSQDDPRADLTGRPGVLETGKRIARRASIWPTAAIENAVAVEPMPFMPRGDDLRGAEHVGYRFASLERGFEVLGSTITGTKKTGTLLRHLIPLLDGSCTLDQLATSSERKNMLELLDRLTVLEALDDKPLRHLFERPKRAQVTWLGHGAVLLQVGGASVIFDPLFFSKSDPEERGLSSPKFDPRALPEIDAVFITHGDNDHLNANTLAQLPANTPVYLPRMEQRPGLFQVDMRGVLRVLGFENVFELDARSGVSIGELTVSAWPFEGEDWGLPLAKATFLAETERHAIFLSADAYRMDDVYRELAGRKIDLAFMGVSGNAETFVMPEGFGYGNFYREWVPRVRHNEWVRHCSAPADAAHSLALFKPRFAFGYAAGGASYIRTEYSDTGDHQTLAKILREQNSETKPVDLPLGTPVALDDLAERTT